MCYRFCPLLLSLLLCTTAHAQLYKSVAPDGTVIYSDKPPPVSAKVEKKSVANGGARVPLPYELAEAVRKNPVTLYSAPNCLACDDARNALRTRGIPFAEKTVQSNEDIAYFRQIGGAQELPFLTVGTIRESGYAPDNWNRILTAAGYPANSRLPRAYQYPATQPAAPVKEPEAEKSVDAQGETPQPALPDDVVPETVDRPDGFRF